MAYSRAAEAIASATRACELTSYQDEPGPGGHGHGSRHARRGIRVLPVVGDPASVRSPGGGAVDRFIKSQTPPGSLPDKVIYINVRILGPYSGSHFGAVGRDAPGAHLEPIAQRIGLDDEAVIARGLEGVFQILVQPLIIM